MEVKNSSQAILNNKQLQWSFMRKATFALFFLHLVVAALTHSFANNNQVYKDFLRNYSGVGNGYDIFALVVIGLIFILSVALPKQLKSSGIVMYAILVALIGFMIVFSLNFS